MNEPVADLLLAAWNIGRLSVEELPSGFRVVAPRRFLWQLFVVAGIMTAVFSLIAGPKGTSARSAFIFYMSFATVVTLIRVKQRQRISVSASEILVRHENFGICWWKSRYSTEPTCEIDWGPGSRRQPSALELSCGKSRSRFGFEITQEEAAELLRSYNEGLVTSLLFAESRALGSELSEWD